MFVPQRKYTYGLSQLVTGIALLFYFTTGHKSCLIRSDRDRNYRLVRRKDYPLYMGCSLFGAQDTMKGILQIPSISAASAPQMFHMQSLLLSVLNQPYIKVSSLAGPYNQQSINQ
jgi:hypothetical protein